MGDEVEREACDETRWALGGHSVGTQRALSEHSVALGGHSVALGGIGGVSL